MSPDAWLTLGTIALMVIGLMAEVFTPDVLVAGALITLLFLGILTPEEAFQGFSNPAMITVGALFIVARAMSSTGALDVLSSKVLGEVKTTRGALFRMTGVTAVLSAFLNNTPIVAMFIPVIDGWCRRRGISPSKLLIPLSYSAILGGVCTLIGTSTNLLVSGLLVERGMEPLGMWELTPIGLPVACVGIMMVVLLGPKLLPDRGDPLAEAEAHRREYMVDMALQGGSPLVGKSVEEGGLRQLEGVFLVRIERGERAISPVGPREVLLEGDRLIFAGAVETIQDLKRLKGLVPVNRVEQAGPEGRASVRLIEAVISPSSPLVGRSLKEAGFRGRYNAAVVAIHRGGERLEGKVGEVPLKAGDTLLLEARPSFLRTHRRSADFYLVSEVEESSPVQRDLAWVPVLVLIGIVTLSTFEILPIVSAALLGAVACAASGVMARGEARRAVDPSVLMVIGASFGLATSMEKTGAAQVIADQLVGFGAQIGVFGTLASIFIATMLLTETISNNAAAALMFPIAIVTANELGLPPQAFAVSVAIAASLSFITPLGYQTNMMVYGPGGYRFLDFLRLGLPIQVVAATTALVSVYFFYL